MHLGRGKSHQSNVEDDNLDSDKYCQLLIEEFIQDIESYDADKYRSELMAIREKNKKEIAIKEDKSKPAFEYQSKKRLKTMSLLKNKVPHVKIEEKYLTKDEIYNQAKNLFKKRIDEQKEVQRLQKNESLKDIKLSSVLQNSTGHESIRKNQKK